MDSKTRLDRSTLIPCLRYRNCAAAIEWLCQAVGFEARLVIPGENGEIVHAQLVLGGGMVMVGSVRQTQFSKYMIEPDQTGGAETQTAYVVVPDADAVYLAVQVSGGEILMEIHDEDYGGRGFAFRDPQGHVWYVGTYDPWA